MKKKTDEQKLTPPLVVGSPLGTSSAKPLASTEGDPGDEHKERPPASAKPLPSTASTEGDPGDEHRPPAQHSHL